MNIFDMGKLEAVRKSLQRPENEKWYREEHGITVDDFTCYNVCTYGVDNHEETGEYTALGEIADLIIADDNE